MLRAERSRALPLAVASGGAILFLGSLLFLLYCLVTRFARPAPPGPLVPPVLVNLALFTLFAAHHSVLARPAMKARVRRVLPAELERSVYVWISSLLFLAVCWWWQPVPGLLYRLDGWARAAGYAVQAAGVIISVRASAKLDPLDLAGIRPVLRTASHVEAEHVPLRTDGLYRLVRHPLYFGWVLVVFGAPIMTGTVLAFAIISTAYLAIAIPWEERGLIAIFGPEYRDYQRRVRWRMLPGIY